MDPIRVHLGEMPQMLRAMIKDLLADENDIAIVGNSYAGEDSILMANADQADMLIAQEPASANQYCLSAVIDSVPSTILAISSSGSGGTAINLMRRQILLDGSETPGLANAIRDAAGRR
jgi:hypothetical protein